MMTLEILPKKIPMDLAIIEFGMSNMKKTLAIKTIMNYSKYDGLPIYFDDFARGIDAEIMIGNIVDEKGESVDFIIPEPEDIIPAEGQKKLENAFVFSDKIKQKQVCINSFSKDNIRYHVIHESGSQYSDICVGYKKLYFDREELLTFMDEMARSDPPTKSPSPSATNKTLSPEIKALALLARDKAENSPRFKHGNNVNASVFKEHIVQLAEKHDQSIHGLNSLDDKISKALVEYDLRDITDI